jgi:hypothetical protein
MISFSPKVESDIQRSICDYLALNAARDRNTPIRAHQINSQISFISVSIN